MNEHAEVDIDLLADYIGGALDGPDAAAVARLIADDPRWRSTYDLLAPGMAEVGSGLQALGARPEPMPADVAARLDAVLTGADAASPIAEPTVIDPELAQPSEPHPVPVSGGQQQPHVVRAPGADRSPRRRRRLRWAAPIAAAAGVVAFAAIGFGQLSGDSAEDATSGAGSAEQAAPMMESQRASLPPDDAIVTSGTNYTSPTLGEPSRVAMAEPEAPKRNRAEASPEAPAAAGMDTGTLRRLRVREALVACLEAIAQERGGTPITVETVDYARYQGAPALIVRFVADGVTWAVAAGPECGTPERGASLLETLRVG
jgi:hypothetical protein